jgi:hypothetical protein
VIDILRRVVPALVAALVLATPRLADACAMCIATGKGGKQGAFAIGSLFLSVMPLVVVGGMVFYLRRRAKAIEREMNERRAAAELESVAVGRSVGSR